MGIRKRGQNFFIDYYYAGHRVREMVGTSKEDAKHALTLRQAEIVNNKFHLPAEDKLTFDEAAVKYLDWSREHKRSWIDDRGMLQRLNKDLSGMPLARITPWHIEQTKHRLLKGGASGSRVNRYLATLSSLFHRMKDWGLYSGENPVRQVRKFRESPGRIRYLTKDEMDRLLGFCNEDLRAVVIVALQTGMRQGEIFALRWCDVDLENKIIRVCDSKNGSRRDIPMCEGVHQALKERSQKHGGEYIFAQADGRLHNTRMRTAWKLACKKAELPDMRFHDLRHTFASHLVMNGASLFAVQTIMGHQSLDMTRRYSHLAPGVLRDAVVTMDKVMNQPSPAGSVEHLRHVLGTGA